jgi:hypothetical protein
MKKIFPFSICLWIALLFDTSIAHAQVTGNVSDSTGHPLLFCNVMLLKTADSVAVTGTSTDEAGNFTLEKKDTGSFRLLISYSGYADYYSTPFSLSEAQPKYDAGKITLLVDHAVLDIVQIVAQKPFMEQKLDRVVFNIENSVISSGSNGLEVLKKLPGVNVDNNDNIQVRGKSGVRFMINGRMSYLSGGDIASYLRSLDASQIEKIEVITNPSAKYEAAGNAIINIVLKKDKNLGFNGMVHAGGDQGVYTGGHAGMQVNYRTKKWNFFASENFYRGQFYEHALRETVFSTNELISATADVKLDGFWNYSQAGVDFTPNDKHTLGFSAERSGGGQTQKRHYDAQMFDANSSLDSSQVTRGHQTNRMTFYTFDLNYKFNIDTTGKELTADLNYAPFFNNTTRLNSTDFYNSAGQRYFSAQQNSYLPIEVSILAGQVDYAQPIGKKLKFETGMKGSIVSTDNDARYFNVINGEEINDTTLSNHFLYDENIYSAYANYVHELNARLSFQVGFRGEQTQTKGTQLVNDSVFTRKYFNLFPSAFLNWQVDSLHALNFSYSRRIDRPDYGQLNPFLLFLNPYTYNSGNPYLRPQLYDNYQITHVFNNMLNTTIGYMHMTNTYTLVTYADTSTHIFYNRTENLSTYNVFSITASLTYPVTSWFTTVTTLNAYRDHYFGIVNGNDFSIVQATWAINSLNMFSLKKGWSIEASFFYRSLNQNAVWTEAPISSFDVGVRKKFADGRGTVSVNFSDIFWTSYQNGSAAYPAYTFKATGRMDSRRAGINLTWKLGQSQYQREQKQKSAEDQLNRANSR